MADPVTRDLIQRLADALERAQSDLYFNGGCTGATDKKRRNLLAEAGAYLAQPEPEPAAGPTQDEIRSRFQAWWNNEGSAMQPLPDHDHEEHARRISEIAWDNGAYVTRYPLPLPEAP